MIHILPYPAKLFTKKFVESFVNQQIFISGELLTKVSCSFDGSDFFNETVLFRFVHRFEICLRFSTS